MTVSVEDAARHLADISGWKLSNLELQKMLYMADMNFVGLGKGRLLDEDFEAWDFGPVIPSLYHTCKAFGSKRVPDVFWGASDISDTPEAAIIESAWKNLRGQNPGRLVENTHWSGGAWAKRYIPGAKGIRITSSDMMDEHKNRIARAKAQARKSRAA